MNNIMFIVGEASADAHAAELINALRKQAPEIQLFGAGGPKMRAAGMELLLDLTEHAVVGLVEVLKNYATFKRIFDDLLAEVTRRKPDAIVLVDFPGFNLRFAAAVKKRNPSQEIIYYISPQLWAWHASRAKQIERDVDLMLVIFPFEKEWYAQHAPMLRVEFVGHPMSGTIPQSASAGGRDQRLVLLLPGSREREVKKIFPILAKVAARMPDDVKFIAAATSEKLAQMIHHPRVEVQVGKAHALMRRAALAITASGTATMECAFFGCPMVVVYKVNWLTYLVGRRVVKVKWLAMPNVIAGSEIIPEFIQHQAMPHRIADAAMKLLQDPACREAQRQALAGVVTSLQAGGASQRAADLILGVVR